MLYYCNNLPKASSYHEAKFIFRRFLSPPFHCILFRTQCHDQSCTHASLCSEHNGAFLIYTYSIFKRQNKRKKYYNHSKITITFTTYVIKLIYQLFIIFCCKIYPTCARDVINKYSSPLAATIVAVRKLAATESRETNNFYFFLFSSIISGMIALLFWAPITLGLWLTLGMGLIYFASQYLYTSSLSYANAQIIGSLLYTNIINSVIISALVWHTFPSTLTLIGVFLTIIGGVMCIRVEYQQRKHEIAIADGVPA